MSGVNELEELLAELVADGMIVRTVMVPVQDVVFFKSVLEAYPGLAAVHASRRSEGRGTTSGASVPLAVATTAELAGELDEVLSELAHTIGLSVVCAGSADPLAGSKERAPRSESL